MSFLRFLSYEKPYVCLYLIGTLIPCAVFSAASDEGWAWGILSYAVILSMIVLIGFLLLRYQQNARVIRKMKVEDYESLTLEGDYAKQSIDELKREHIRDKNAIQNKQQEHYDFIVSWFHEIKTPIAVLRLLQQTDMDADSLREEIGKIENYVDQALYYAKLDSFNQDYDIQNCDVIQISKELIKSHSKTFFAKKIRIQLQADSLKVQSDGKWLHFIINQLLTNSLKYTNHGGEIAISVNETSTEKQLVIRDNGIGISQKDLPRIFNRGFTGETGRTHSKSTGMGLYLAQELSKKLGAYITCTSELASFTEFMIHFPKNHDPYLIRQKARDE